MILSRVELWKTIFESKYIYFRVILRTYESRQSHSSDCADELDGGTVVEIAIFDGELFALAAVVVDEIDGERAPLIGTGVEHAVLAVQIAGAHGLRAQTIEQRHFGARRNANLFFFF